VSHLRRFIVQFSVYVQRFLCTVSLRSKPSSAQHCVELRFPISRVQSYIASIQCRNSLLAYNLFLLRFYCNLYHNYYYNSHGIQLTTFCDGWSCKSNQMENVGAKFKGIICSTLKRRQALVTSENDDYLTQGEFRVSHQLLKL
jgi:hypothetical protein